MKPAVPFLIGLWIPAIIFLFKQYPKRRAVIVAFVGGILFLPGLLDKAVSGDAPSPLPIPFFPFTKQNVICLAVLVAAVIFDQKRLLDFRFRWFDIPMILWCLCPFLSAITNDPPKLEEDPDAGKFGFFGPIYLGPLYDGFSQSRIQLLNWSVPYFIGRIYFNDAQSMRELGIGMLIGALAYVPLCLFEWRMSPLCHSLVYGFEQHEPGQAKRGDSWRPVVFMEHGLAVGMWLSATMLLAFWFWWSGALKSIKLPRSSLEIPMWAVFAILFGTSVIIKSGGAFMLGILGLVCLIAIKKIGPRPVMVAIAMIAPLYIVGRLTTMDAPTGWTKERYNRWKNEEELAALEKRSLDKPMFSWGWWSSNELANAVSTDVDRQGSLTFRLSNEDKLMEKTRERPWFGWGGWNRAKVLVEEGEEDVGDGIKLKDLVTVDSLWIITYANRGAVGLTLLYVAMLLPMLRLAWVYPREYWTRPEFATIAVGAVFVTLWMFDNVLNNMFNPVYVLIAGGIMSLTATGKPLPLVEGAAAVPVPVPQPAPGIQRVLQPGGYTPPAPPPVGPPPQPPPVPQPAEGRKPGLLRRRLPGQT